MTTGAGSPLRMARAVPIVLMSTVALTGALWLGKSSNIWLATGSAALFSSALAWALARPRLLTLFRRDRQHIVLALALGLVSGALTLVVYRQIAPSWPPLEAQVSQLLVQLAHTPGLPASFPVVALVVITEEVVWRGLLFDALRGRLPLAATLMLCTLGYAVPQVASGSWLLVVLALGAGGFWTAERALTNGLTAPSLTHVAWDVVVFVGAPQLML